MANFPRARATFHVFHSRIDCTPEPEHSSGSAILLIGKRVGGGVYGDMFPESKLARLNGRSPEIEGLTTIDEIYSRVCDWVSPGSGGIVFPDRSLSLVEDGIDLDSLFI